MTYKYCINVTHQLVSHKIIVDKGWAILKISSHGYCGAHYHDYCKYHGIEMNYSKYTQKQFTYIYICMSEAGMFTTTADNLLRLTNVRPEFLYSSAASGIHAYSVCRFM